MAVEYTATAGPAQEQAEEQTINYPRILAMNFTAVIAECKTPGKFWGYVKEIRGVVTEGDSREEVRERLEQQAYLMLDFLSEHEPAELVQLLREQTKQVEKWECVVVENNALAA